MVKDMPRGGPEYYAQRARQERYMAENARTVAARLPHLMLAEQYERIANGEILRTGPLNAKL